jgi:hypothetical protein
VKAAVQPVSRAVRHFLEALNHFIEDRQLDRHLVRAGALNGCHTSLDKKKAFSDPNFPAQAFRNRLTLVVAKRLAGMPLCN